MYFVSFNKDINIELLKKYGGEVKRKYRFMPVVAVNLPVQAVNALQKNPNVEYIEKD
jgi:subtilisin